MTRGCESCRQGYGAQLSATLVPAQQVLSGRAGAWAKDTFRCTRCHQWSHVVWDPRDGIHSQLFYPASLDRAAHEDADIASAWPPLYARERRSYLQHGRYEPEAALARVLELLKREPLVALPMLTDLLTLANPHLRALQAARGPLFDTPRREDFDAPIEHLDRGLAGKAPPDPASVYMIDLECVRSALLRNADRSPRLFRGAAPAPAITPRVWARDFPRDRAVPPG